MKTINNNLNLLCYIDSNKTKNLLKLCLTFFYYFYSKYILFYKIILRIGDMSVIFLQQ